MHLNLMGYISSVVSSMVCFLIGYRDGRGDSFNALELLGICILGGVVTFLITAILLWTGVLP